MALNDLGDGIYYGTQYYRAPTPVPESWERDIKTAKKLGMTHVQLWCQWRWHERKRGEFLWDDTDRLFDLAEKEGLQVIVMVMLETAPAWLFRKYDCERVDPRGHKICAGPVAAYYVGGWWPCFENPNVRSEAERFITATVNRYSSRKNLLVFHAWNELASKPGGDCACEACKVRYRKWLRAKFTTVESLNAEYGKAWGDFDEIDPPAMYEDYAELYLWRTFRIEEMADRAKWITGIIKTVDQKHPVIVHCGWPSPITDILCGSADDHLLAQSVDFMGTSLSTARPGIKSNYPFWPSLANDSLRSVSDYYWVMEIYPSSMNWNIPLGPEEMRHNVWTCAASGAKGLTYWQFKCERYGIESNSDGLVEMNGDPTDRSDEAGRIGALLKGNLSILSQCRASKASIAVVYDGDSDLLSRLEETSAETLNYNMYQPGIMHYRYNNSIQGLYRYLWEHGYRVDFVYSRDIEKIKSYPVVWTPYFIMMNRHKAAVLKEFVKAGGKLISDASPGLRLANTWASETCPGYGLDEVFGAVEKLRIVNPTYQKTLKFGEEAAVISNNVISDLAPTTAKVLAKWQDGQAAITMNTYGNGEAILCGTCPGISYIKRQEDSLKKLIAFVLTSAGLKPDVEVVESKGMIITRLMDYGDKKLIFVFNCEDFEHECVIGDYRPAAESDLINDSPVVGTERGLSLTLAPYEVAAVETTL